MNRTRSHLFTGTPSEPASALMQSAPKLPAVAARIRAQPGSENPSPTLCCPSHHFRLAKRDCGVILQYAVHPQLTWEAVMAVNKTATLTLRIEPSVKEVLRAAAQEEHRSIANMVEVMILDYCQRHGLPVKGSTKSEIQGDQAE